MRVPSPVMIGVVSSVNVWAPRIRVVADALDAQEAPVGGEADLPQGGQVVGAQPVGQSEVAGVVGRPVGQPTNRSARFIHRTGAPVTV